jgi:hypothetical protein
MSSTDWYFLIGLLVLTVLLTGPGLWSEKWGWGTLGRLGKRLGRKKGKP